MGKKLNKLIKELVDDELNAINGDDYSNVSGKGGTNKTSRELDRSTQAPPDYLGTKFANAYRGFATYGKYDQDVVPYFDKRANLSNEITGTENEKSERGGEGETKKTHHRKNKNKQKIDEIIEDTLKDVNDSETTFPSKAIGKNKNRRKPKNIHEIMEEVLNTDKDDVDLIFPKNDIEDLKKIKDEHPQVAKKTASLIDTIKSNIVNEKVKVIVLNSLINSLDFSDVPIRQKRKLIKKLKVDNKIRDSEKK